LAKYSANDRLKDLRKELGLNQEEMAQVLGLKQGSYSDIERGRVGVSGILTKLIKLYKINPVWLIEGEGEKTLDASERIFNHTILTNEDEIESDEYEYKKRIFELIEVIEETDNRNTLKAATIELKGLIGRFVLENSKLLQETSDLKDEIIRLLKKQQNLKNILNQ